MPGNPLHVAVFTTLVLGVGKLVAGWLTGSTAVLASAMDSLADGGVSAFNLFMMRHAARPADADHHFGHGKAEALASLAQAAVLGALVVGVAWRAFDQLVGATPTPVAALPGIAVMLVSMAGSLGISTFLSRAADRTGSLVLRTDAVHYRMDLYTGAAIVVGLVVTWLTAAPRADAVASLLVCVLMAKDVGGLLRDAVGELMDQALPVEEHAAVVRALESFDERILGWHELRTRRAGPKRFVQVNVLLPGAMSLHDAHMLAHEVEDAVKAALHGVDVIVHVDAAEHEGGPPI